MAQPGKHLDLILLELLPGTSPVALLPPPEIGVDRIAIEPQTGREPRHDRDKRGTMGFAGGYELERHDRSLDWTADRQLLAARPVAKTWRRPSSPVFRIRARTGRPVKSQDVVYSSA